MQLEVTAAVLDWCAPKSFYDSALNGDTAEVAIERHLQRLLGNVPALRADGLSKTSLLRREIAQPVLIASRDT